MAAQARPFSLTGQQILDRIRRHASFDARPTEYLFVSAELREIEDALAGFPPDEPEARFQEWKSYNLAVKDRGPTTFITALADERERFSESLRRLEASYLQRSILYRDSPLEDLVLLGQEILRRKYFALLRHPGRNPRLSPWAGLIVETGAAAIQVLGRAPASPKYRYRKFSERRVPDVSTLGIEILSSGAFPDPTDPAVCSMLKDNSIGMMGFETVIHASSDTPRARVLGRLLSEGRELGPLVFPMYQRLMLDLELMRLGQATTPGTYTMLLNSFFQGALFVDHSTNVSEQVQIIYEEENWKPAWRIGSSVGKNAGPDGAKAAAALLTGFFRNKGRSPIGRDHPREARIEFTEIDDRAMVVTFFSILLRTLERGVNDENGRVVRQARVHTILPVLRLEGTRDPVKSVRQGIEIVRESGLRELAITAGVTRHAAGLLQYFPSVKDANEALEYAQSRKVRLKDARTLDMVATANKAIEAAAGAIQSGQGCIKVGLLGLTLEQMREFIHRVKKGLGAAYTRQQNQLLVFIGIVDEPLVSELVVYDTAPPIAGAFVNLMRSLRHDILLLDTMHKGADDKRLVDAHSVDPADKKGGHLTIDEIRTLVRQAQKARCDLWVAGSYTEEQVYQASKDPLESRPSLICLGGAERSFGGLRLDPSASYLSQSKDKMEAQLAAFVEFDADIKYLLSRDNKLARDAGHVVGELQRRKKKGWNDLEAMRRTYLGHRNAYFAMLKSFAEVCGLATRNVDTLHFDREKLFARQSPKEKKALNDAEKLFESSREKYVETVAQHMYELFRKEWLPSKDDNYDDRSEVTV